MEVNNISVNQKYTVIRLDSVTSTNDYLKENAHMYADRTVVVSKNQTAGRGRNTNIWFSNSNSLTFSMLFFPEIQTQNLALLNLFPAVAVCRALQKLDIPAKIKWPNDVYINGHKVSGILCESRIDQKHIRQFIAGIGINVQQFLYDFPKHIKNAGSIYSQTGRQFSKKVIFYAVLDELVDLYEQCINVGNFDEIRKMWYDCCFHINADVTLIHNECELAGTFKGIAENGSALIKTENGIQKIMSYDKISLRGFHAFGC